MNPLLSRERDAVTGEAPEKKKVLVIGGGQAGMLAAVYAAKRGHTVTLAERRDTLGGHMLEGSAAPFKKETAAYLQWILRQLAKTNVEVRTGVEVDEAYVREACPDAVILCSGSVPFVPDVPGLDKSHVLYATDVLLDDSSVKGDVLIVGSGLVGCETAVDLARKGKRVTITDMTAEIGQDIIPLAKTPMLEELEKRQITMRPGLRLSAVTDEGVTCIDTEGNAHTLKADTVILATGLRADNSLLHALTDLVPEVYQAGDCVRARQFIDANREAYAVASVL